ncbi:quinone oxidoreductase [Dacryopinax primogenitus]|uniref:Quinone oxidoreductase n=1 Tax=Dacryopinax primogenitus (strain DJM 731) TaxID=1858805 RepID=M5G3Z9_DACPD|nr:quinone oxidoreductase [Dacryopinax primogenitus]EJU02935.1 quinone oxidoreductase [Dacryopinax primogenitus]
MASKMRAILIKNGAGTADDLYIGECDKPIPKEGEVLVKVKAAGINRMDVIQRGGGYPLPPQASKDILGVEFAGIVEELGGQVTAYKVGDEIFGLLYGGAYAEYVTVACNTLMHKPSSLSFVEAAGVPEAWFTAFQALVLVGGLTKGESVLIHAGASGVGIAANQIARFLGAKEVFTTAGDDNNIKFLLSMKEAPTCGINYKKQDFAEVIDKETNGEGVDLIIDFVGKDYFARNIKVLKRDGRLVLLAMLSGSTVPQVDLGPVLYKRIRIQGTTLRSRSPEYQGNLARRFEAELLPFLKGDQHEDGPMNAHIYETYPWEKVAGAHKEMEANRNRGKMVLLIE